jgi:hypothetical protein
MYRNMKSLQHPLRGRWIGSILSRSFPLACAFLVTGLAASVQPIHAQAREHVLLARQVGLPPSQSMVLTIANELTHVTQQAQCHWEGGVRIFDISDVSNPVELEVPIELSLAAGESVAIRNISPLLFEDPTGTPTASPKILDIRLVSAGPTVGPCNLTVEAFGYDAESMETEFLIGGVVNNPPAVPTPAGQSQRFPLGFLGLGSQQTGRVHLREWTDFNQHDPGILPSENCDFSGILVVETIPSRDVWDSSAPGAPLREEFAIEWTDADPRSRMTKAALINVISKAAPGQRAEMLLTIELNDPQPAACLQKLDGSLDIVDAPTGRTRTSQAPPPRFNYRPTFYFQ